IESLDICNSIIYEKVDLSRVKNLKHLKIRRLTDLKNTKYSSINSLYLHQTIFVNEKYNSNLYSYEFTVNVEDIKKLFPNIETLSIKNYELSGRDRLCSLKNLFFLEGASYFKLNFYKSFPKLKTIVTRDIGISHSKSIKHYKDLLLIDTPTYCKIENKIYKDLQKCSQIHQIEILKKKNQVLNYYSEYKDIVLHFQNYYCLLYNSKSPHHNYAYIFNRLIFKTLNNIFFKCTSIAFERDVPELPHINIENFKNLIYLNIDNNYYFDKEIISNSKRLYYFSNPISLTYDKQYVKIKNILSSHKYYKNGCIKEKLFTQKNPSPWDKKERGLFNECNILWWPQ
ncbi:hypothetical protein KKF97_19620, partial [Myxococcota bacterium]|nr:hypothetical protein [Myxococcota bacterium]